MQTIYKRFSVISGFALLLAVLVANAFVMRHQLDTQMERQDWVVHTRQVLFELAKVVSLIKDAETGQRGFLYTGDPKYLAPYQSSISQVEPQIDRLAQLTADNPRQQQRVQRLRNLSREKLAELAQTIALYNANKTSEAKALVLSDAGLRYMNDIRQVVQEMNQEEDSLESMRMASYLRSVQLMSASIYLASGFAALGLILLARYILREMDLREFHARELREREEWFRVTLTSIGDAVIATDPRGLVTFLNPVAESLTGTTQARAKGKDIQEVFPIFSEVTHHPAEDPVRRVIELGRVIGLANHTVLKHVDGSLIPIEDSAAPIRDDREQLIGVVLVFHDVTRERRQQEVLRKTEKLAAAARLSATVAHEINNPLEAVVNLVFLAMSHPDTPPAIAEHLALAENELARVAHIARQTLGFYRDSTDPEMIELPVIIQTVLALYSNKFHTKNIQVRLDCGKCPPISGFPGELRQVFSNLVSNAADAVGEGGVIHITAQPVEDSRGSATEIVIEDDGPGVAPEHITHIFEPFFTTKKDVGTGLGLWIAKEIVERHGGSINVGTPKSSGLHGAAFIIYLPVSPDRASDYANQPSQAN